MTSVVPLFPLPNVVLFPGAVLPLHIFEQRYKAMMEHCLADRRQFAMALLRPGWEKCYYDRPSIEPVVCLGTILTHERLADGRYNLLLRGVSRARIIRELPPSQPFRLAELETFPSEGQTMEIDLMDQRSQLCELLNTGALRHTPWGQAMARMAREPVTTVQLADLMAFSMIEDVNLKQSLLAEPDPLLRIQTTLRAIRKLAPFAAAMGRAAACGLN
jgi:Lon protease-like protein